jgi:chromosome segregation ATPase
MQNQPSVYDMSTYDQVPLTADEYEQRRQRLSSILIELKEDIASLEEQRRALRRRLHVLENQQAEYGLDAPAHIKVEIEDAEDNIRKLDLPIAKYKSQQADVQRQLQALEIHRSEQEHKTEVVDPILQPAS